MKKKSLWAMIVSLFLIIPTMFVFSACKNKHEHEYFEQWSSNETKHWHDCMDADCDAKIDEADHSFGDTWVEGKAATCTEEGIEHLYCSVCGYYKSRAIPAIGHSFEETVSADTSTHKYTLKCKNCEQTKEYDLYTYEFSEDKTYNIIFKDGKYVVAESASTIELVDETEKIYSFSTTDFEDTILIGLNASNYTFESLKAETFGGTSTDYLLINEDEGSGVKFTVFSKNGKTFADKYGSDDMDTPNWVYKGTCKVIIDLASKKFTVSGLSYDIAESGDNNFLKESVSGNLVCEANVSTCVYDFRDNGRVYMLLSGSVQTIMRYERDATNSKILIVKYSDNGGEDQYYYIYEDKKAVGIGAETSSLETMKKYASSYTYTDETNGVLYLFATTGNCLAYISNNGKDYQLGFTSMTWEETETDGVKTITLTRETKTFNFSVDSDGKTLILKSE